MADTGPENGQSGPSMFVIMGAVAAGVVLVLLLALFMSDGTSEQATEPTADATVAEVEREMPEAGVEEPGGAGETPAALADVETSDETVEAVAEMTGSTEEEIVADVAGTEEGTSEGPVETDDAMSPAEDAEQTAEADATTATGAAEESADAVVAEEAPANATEEQETIADSAETVAAASETEAATATEDAASTDTTAATPERTGGVRVTVFGGDNPDEGTRVENAGEQAEAPEPVADDTAAESTTEANDDQPAATADAAPAPAADGDVEALLEIARDASRAASEAAAAANMAAEAARTALELLEEARAAE